MKKLIPLVVFATTFFASQVLADFETEPNNTVSTADILMPGTAISGSLVNYDDIDHFTIEVSGANSLEVKFEADPIDGGDLWQVTVQRPSDGLFLAEYTFSVSNLFPNNEITRSFGIDESGIYLVKVFCGSAFNNTSSCSTEDTPYNLTITPDNFLPEVGFYDGVWADSFNNYYSIHQSGNQIAYILLVGDPSTPDAGWAAFLGTITGTSAILDLVAGAGSSRIELTFTSPTVHAMRFLYCYTASGAACNTQIGVTLYTATKVFSD